MPQIEILSRWDGSSSWAEQTLQQHMKNGEVRQVDGRSLLELMALKDMDTSQINLDDENYYVYYNYHPSSGYRTEIIWDNESNQIKTTISQPKGGVLCAMWPEVIIFKIV